MTRPVTDHDAHTAIEDALDDCGEKLGVQLVVGAVLVWLVERVLAAGWSDDDLLRLIRQALRDARLARRKETN